jgi:hypothetical protein
MLREGGSLQMKSSSSEMTLVELTYVFLAFTSNIHVPQVENAAKCLDEKQECISAFVKRS